MAAHEALSKQQFPEPDTFSVRVGDDAPWEGEHHNRTDAMAAAYETANAKWGGAQVRHNQSGKVVGVLREGKWAHIEHPLKPPHW